MKRVILTAWFTCFLVVPSAFAGASRDFDGVNDSIDLSADSNFGLDSGPATWAAWVRPTSFTSIASQAIVGKAGSGYIRIYVKDDGSQVKCVKVLKDRATSDMVRTTVNNKIALNTWQWIVVTWDGSLNYANIHVYIDNVEPSYQEGGSGSGSENLSSSATWHVGNRESAGTTAPFDGQLAYVHFYNRVLTGTEIAQLKDAPGSIATGLVGYWPLTGSGSQELDGSGNGQHGTVLGATESSENPPISGDAEPPTGTVSINGGAALTNSVNVTLTLSATDNSGTVAQMRFSNDGTSYSTPEAYATSKAWTLTTGDGEKTVYASFKDPTGNWSNAAADTITLDATNPTISAVSASNITQTAATITWTTDENANSTVEYGLTTSYGQTASDTPLVTNHTIGLTGLSDSTTYHYRVKSTDAAGNQATSSDATFQTGADITPPTNTSIVINGGAVATNSATVTLTLVATDPSGVAQMRFSNDNGQTYSTPEPYSTTRSGWILPAGDGSKTVLAQFADTPGNWSTAVSDAIILDTAAPSIEITSPQDGQVILP